MTVEAIEAVVREDVGGVGGGGGGGDGRAGGGLQHRYEEARDSGAAGPYLRPGLHVRVLSGPALRGRNTMVNIRNHVRHYVRHHIRHHVQYHICTS